MSSSHTQRIGGAQPQPGDRGGRGQHGGAGSPPRRRSARTALRAGHLAAAVPFLLYLYGPLEGAEALRDLLRAATAPGLVLSGLALWLQPRMLSALRRRRARVRAGGELPTSR